MTGLMYPSCVKSRTELEICIGYCPLVWLIMLKTDIVTSSVGAEYDDFSVVMKDVLLLPAHQSFWTRS